MRNAYLVDNISSGHAQPIFGKYVSLSCDIIYLIKLKDFWFSIGDETAFRGKCLLYHGNYDLDNNEYIIILFYLKHFTVILSRAGNPLLGGLSATIA